MYYKHQRHSGKLDALGESRGTVSYLTENNPVFAAFFIAMNNNKEEMVSRIAELKARILNDIKVEAEMLDSDSDFVKELNKMHSREIETLGMLERMVCEYCEIKAQNGVYSAPSMN